MARVTTQHVYEIGVLHDRELDRFARQIVQPIKKACGAPRQVNLAQAGRTEVKNSRSQHVAAAVGAAGDITPVAESGNKVVTGRDVQPGGRCDFGQLRFAPRIGHDIENKKGAIERLDSTMVSSHRRTRRHDASPPALSFRLHRISTLPALVTSKGQMRFRAQLFFSHRRCHFHYAKFEPQGWSGLFSGSGSGNRIMSLRRLLNSSSVRTEGGRRSFSKGFPKCVRSGKSSTSRSRPHWAARKGPSARRNARSGTVSFSVPRTIINA